MTLHNKREDINWKEEYKKYEKGQTLTEIAISVNCSPQCVARNFKKLDLKVRTLSEANLISTKLKRGCNNNTRETISIKGKRYLRSHYNWCIANDFPIVPKGCVIHHRDMDKHNNNPENLMLLPTDLHKSFHRQILIEQNPDYNYWGINHLGGG